MPVSSKQRFDGCLGAAVANGVAPGLVAVVADAHGVLYAGAAGLARTDPRRPMAVRSVFRIASMTKLVTSLAVMMLVEEGKIDLEAPLVRYLESYRQPEVLVEFDARTKTYVTRPSATPITIRQLLTHTSGYGYWWLDAPLLALTSMPPDVLNAPFLMYPPGERFAYGVSTDVLAQIFAPVAGLPFEEFFAQRIYAPLGMRDTGYALPVDRDRLVSIHARSSSGFAEQPIENSAAAPRGGGGLYSTALDYIELLRLFLRGGEIDGRRLLAPELVAAMTRNQIGPLPAAPQRTALPARSNDLIFMDGTQKFGFGVMVETRERSTGRHAGSYGWGGIYNTYFWVDPRAERAAVVLAQTSPFADPRIVELCLEFERIVYAV